tara:strand:- start:7250 stop:7555 length:306 start_codon:yes stop_codon:yes gene_type:complete
LIFAANLFGLCKILVRGEYNKLKTIGETMTLERVESEITGNVWKIEVKPGDKVEAEDVIMILESMKMEIPVEAPCAGTIKEILVSEEDAVDEDQVLATIES